MPEFLELLSPTNALQTLLSAIRPDIQSEEVDMADALGRITAQPVLAPHPLPQFRRSTVDGYAVRASDTFGAGEGLPAYLRVVGEVRMGQADPFQLESGECVLIHTGGMLPENADAVVMLEHTQAISPQEIEVYRAVAVGENVLKTGEDVSAGDVVIPTGKMIRPAEIGGLMALGITRLLVVKKPRVGIISSGDELVNPGANPPPGMVRDINSYSLSGLVQAAGGIPQRFGIVPDDFRSLRETAKQALESCEMVVITAGSSASTRDMTSQVIQSLGSPGVLVHGINIRPGKPTILAVCEVGGDSAARPVIGLPGNPVSALVIATLFIVPVLEALQGLERRIPRNPIQARLRVNVASQAGREDWVPVRLMMQGSEWIAEPIFSKSNHIFSLVRADGLLRIPPDATGAEAGRMVEIMLF